jgi:HAE1 family hydrophobic/amphiphilic exporter-1
LTLWDNSKFIKNSIDNVRRAALFGSALAVIVLFVFLRDVRSTLIIASAIPVSVMASFSLIYFSDFTLNIVSFGGLALGVGLLVDSSIVVLENIYRHRESGQDARSAAIDGTQEVSTAIIASTMTTLVVFLPLLFLSGAASIMFTQLAYVVAFSLACSLTVSLTLVPTLARRLLHVESLERTPGETVVHKIYRVSEEMFKRVEASYQRLLHFSLSHRLLVATVSCSLLAASLPLYHTLGFEYMPSADEGEVRVYGYMAPGTRLEALDEAFTELENIAKETLGDDILHISTRFGASSWYMSGSSTSGRMEVELVDVADRDISSAEAANLLREKIGVIPGVRTSARPGGGLWIFRQLAPDGESITIEIRGHDPVVAMSIAEEIKGRLSAIDGVKDPNMRDAEGRPELGLMIDRYKAAEAGFTVTSVAQAIRTNFGGEIATRFRDGGEEFDVRVRLKEDDRQSVKDLQSQWLATPSGERVPASNFIRQEMMSGPLEIRRKNQERILTVNADLDPAFTLGNVMQDVEASLSSIPMPDGFSIVYGGEYEEQQKSHRDLAMGLALAILLVYMVMAAQFESLIQPFVIMFASPFATIGILGILWLTKTSLSIQSILGIIVLVGIVVNNAIVLVDYINLLRRRKMPLHEAVEEGGRRRLRPIIMTTLTTTLALSPMAIGMGSGGELQAPMARVVIGGLLTSTLITLVFVPVLYTTLEEVLESGGFWRKNRTALTDGDPGDALSAK